MTRNKPPWHKPIRNQFTRWFRGVRYKVISISPPWVRRVFEPIYDYFDMMFIDHGIFRLLYLNRHKISDKVWRSAQPWPFQVRRMARKDGVRTIVNLRGARDCGAYRLEEKACETAGLKLDNSLRLMSRAAPSRQTILEFRSLFEELEYPVLIHCKSGADRMGLAAVLYLHLVEDMPIEEARDQLSLRYGHIRHARTGILDAFFEAYLAYRKEHDISFIEWVENVYSEVDLESSFYSQSLADMIVDGILRRE